MSTGKTLSEHCFSRLKLLLVFYGMPHIYSYIQGDWLQIDADSVDVHDDLIRFRLSRKEVARISRLEHVYPKKKPDNLFGDLKCVDCYGVVGASLDELLMELFWTQ